MLYSLPQHPTLSPAVMPRQALWRSPSCPWHAQSFGGPRGARVGGLSQALKNIHTHTPPCPQPSVSFCHTIGPCLRAPSEQLWQWGMRQPRQAGTEWVAARAHLPPLGCQALAVSIKVRQRGMSPREQHSLMNLGMGMPLWEREGPGGLPCYGQCPSLSSSS